MIIGEAFESRGLGKCELPCPGTPQLREVGSAAEGLAEVVSERANIGSGRNFGDEAGAIAKHSMNFEATNLDFDGLHLYRLVFAGAFVGSDSINLLRRVDWRKLQDASGKGREMAMDVGQGWLGAGDGADG